MRAIIQSILHRPRFARGGIGTGNARDLAKEAVLSNERSHRLTMTLATITRKGQTTIPKKFREHLKLRANERIAFELRGDELVIRRAGASIDELAGSLKSSQPYVGKKAEHAAVAAHLAQRPRSARTGARAAAGRKKTSS